MKQKLTEMIERYGKVAIYLYLGIFAATLISVWLLVQNGVELQQVSWFKEGLAGKAGTLTIAYVVTKILQPLRIGLTLLLLPLFGKKTATAPKSEAES